MFHGRVIQVFRDEVTRILAITVKLGVIFFFFFFFFFMKKKINVIMNNMWIEFFIHNKHLQ